MGACWLSEITTSCMLILHTNSCRAYIIHPDKAKACVIIVHMLHAANLVLVNTYRYWPLVRAK